MDAGEAGGDEVVDAVEEKEDAAIGIGEVAKEGS